MSTRPIGAAYGLAAAILFGASTPFAKSLLEHCQPIMLAGLLYLGSGLGLGLWYLVSRAHRSSTSLTGKDWLWLALAILCGGIIAPILLMYGLKGIAASTGSLLLNLEAVFTAALAWFLFRENFDRPIFLGMVAILAGAVILGWPSGGMKLTLAALPIAGACLAWGFDNNFTRYVSSADPVQVAGLKGVVAGVVNVSLALSLGQHFPAPATTGSALVLGLLSYGVSLTCFVLALRHLGTARTGAYFSTAPFVGAAVSMVVFREMPGVTFWLAGLLMAWGVWLHLSEHHEHLHEHEPMAHSHEHVHDEHHQHTHSESDPAGEPHSHHHEHPRIRHKHPHFPDIHHRHPH